MNTGQSSLRLGFAGTPRFAVVALDALASSAHTLQAVFTQPDRPAGRGRTLHPSPVKQRAQELGIAVHQPASFKTPEAVAELSALRLDVLVVAAYGLILPPAALAVPRLGCINIHASLLPRWRGAAPIQRALLAADARTGISIMRMEAGLDTGPVLSSRAVEIALLDTAGSLEERLAIVGGELCCLTLDAIASGSAIEAPQPRDGVTYAEKISKAEALIDWGEDAAHILRRIRAFNPWPVAETRLDGTQLRIWEAELAPDAQAAHGAELAAGRSVLPGTVQSASAEGIDVVCGRGVLRIARLQLAGRKPLTAREFIQARPLEGARFRDS